jgi:hypothetical protein
MTCSKVRVLQANGHSHDTLSGPAPFQSDTPIKSRAFVAPGETSVICCMPSRVVMGALALVLGLFGFMCWQSLGCEWMQEWCDTPRYD